MANLFKQAKKTGVKKDAKAKEQKVRIRIKDGEFFDKVSRLSDIQESVKSLEAEKDIITDELKDIAKSEWVELYEKTGKYPGSVMLEGKNKLDTAQFMFVPSDKYISINEERAEELTEKYGEEIVTETTEYSFDKEMVDKYGEIISTLISESDEIDEDDKEKIIKAVTKFTIAKGTIEKMNEFDGVSVGEVMTEIKPVIAIKTPEVIKSSKD